MRGTDHRLGRAANHQPFQAAAAMRADDDQVGVPLITRRVDGRRVREYVGRGLIGELAAREDVARREARRAAWPAARAARQLRELVATIERQATALTTITLTAAGYHLPKRGIWRRRRAHGTR